MSLTPMMNQYLQVKEKCKDCILFFRIGDFYEMFFDDAKTASRELELVLTGKDCGLKERAPMCGIPHHAAASYIGRLVSRGFKVAICEQLEDPALAKGLVKRDIIKIVTPGTYTDTSFLEETKNNYLMSLYIDKKNNKSGMSFSDISTGEFSSTYAPVNSDTIVNEISKFMPSEIIVQEDIDEKIIEYINERFNISLTKKNEDYFKDNIKNNLTNIIKDDDYKNADESELYSSNALINYILETQKASLSNINKIDFYNIVDYLVMDANSRRNLELTETMKEKRKKGSLLWIIDKTVTAMGARELRRWIDQPLIDKNKICGREDAVEELINNYSLLSDLRDCLKDVYDIERISGRISSKSVNAKEMLALKNSINKIPKIKETIGKLNSSQFKYYFENMDELNDIYKLLENSISETPSISIKEGNIIKKGFNEEVDNLRSSKKHGKEWIASLESKEREATGIKSLKIGYNKVFGYYIDVTKTNIGSIPEGRYIRKQTLANSERYITPELKEMEEKIVGAEDKLVNLEYEIFVDIRNKVESQIDRMKKSAKIISQIDCLSSFAVISLNNNYCKPEIIDTGEIIIKDGRHPVIEKMLPQGSFISNDTYINNTDEQLLVITGPNMAGKSTYMRQVALIVIMAQIGCFVPAKSAKISICDKIFTRIGASDDIASGKSTFMVEMWEVSNILKHATNKSLVLLDEVGRGTSTYDGLSIAWSVIEYMCNNSSIKSKTLFATHYHELTKLEGKIKGVKNYSVAVKKINDEIVFLRKIIPKGADESYGIEVAKLAGLPEKVIKKAREILNMLESQNSKNKVKKVKEESNVKQLGFKDFEKDSFIENVSSIDVVNITPMECMNKLYDIVNKAKHLK